MLIITEAYKYNINSKMLHGKPKINAKLGLILYTK